MRKELKQQWNDLLDSRSIWRELATPLAGITGCLILISGMYVSAQSYYGEGLYSPMNHFISELGCPDFVHNPAAFNRSVMLAGIFILFFISGLGRYLKSDYLSRAARVFGGLSAVFFSSVGYFSVELPLAHYIVATLFFAFAMLALVCFSYALYRDEEKRFHPFFLAQSGLIALVYFIALAWPKGSFIEYVTHPETFVRPDFWALTFIEWLYCLLIASWILTISGNLLYNFALSYLPKTNWSGDWGMWR